MPVRLLPVVMPEVLPRFSRAWPQRTACRIEDPGIFFPAHGAPGIEARRVCDRCPVRIDCLEHATTKDEWGIWGGLDRDQRRALGNGADEQVSPPQMTAQANANEAAHA
jgi:WhiB family transcriptional regulator, redox-sensing transcriptional regulator